MKVIPRLAPVVARVSDHIADAVSLNNARDVIAAIGVDYNVCLVGLAEKIMITAHHFLIGADQKDGDVIRLACKWV